MAAEGLSNRQIAERLYMSHRTVASHLYRIFPKLGIGSRSQLIALSLDLPAAPEPALGVPAPGVPASAEPAADGRPDKE
jgi:hypothetical protein